MSWLSSFLHPGRAYEKSGQESERYYNQGQKYLQPYNQYGQEAGENLSNAMQRLLHPQGLYDEFMQGYEQSPYAIDMQERANQHGMNAANSMGLMGSTPALQAIQSGATAIGNQDRENYFQRLMDMYFKGAGIGQNIYGTGAQVGAQMGQNAINQGNNAAESVYNQNAAGGNMFGNIAGTAAGMAMGGPIGGALANKFIGSYQPWSTGGSMNKGRNSPVWGGNF
jgi:hypothetical protein